MTKSKNPIFGLTGSGGRSFRGGSKGNTRFTGRRDSQRGRGGGGGQDVGSRVLDKIRADEGTALQERAEEVKVWDEIDEKQGFWRFESGKAGGEEREGWLVNMHQTLLITETHPSGLAAVDYYFIQDNGASFKATVPFEPYVFLGCRTGTETIVEEWLLKRFEGLVVRVERQQKWDLKVPNHLLSKPSSFIRLYFHNTADLQAVRREVSALALSNSASLSAVDAYAEAVGADAAMAVMIEDEDGAQAAWGAESGGKAKGNDREPSECIVDIREHDINYYQRVAIDLDIRVGLWYTVRNESGVTTLTRLASRVKRAEPVVMAYDIETSKQPLKFPDQLTDQIMMISYMIDGHGYLITNREIVSEDIEDFEYTPKEEYEGEFTVFNEADEPALIRRWFEHIREARPTVMATYNGDSFDFPFVEARAKVHGINMYAETGFKRDREDEFKSRNCAHMDCFRWVKRDSYLPQGSQGLKAVTTAKLGYNPAELDPELMTPYAIEQPHILAQYSVSDAVATYYLYMKYVHPFVFSLCNIIPLNPDEVLRKGSGTLCETLLMVEAYQGGIIMPNRHEDEHGTTYQGHLLAAETYVGGHVEALEAGVFRSDIATDFRIVPTAIQSLIDDLDSALKFSLIEEGKVSLDDVENYDEVKAQIQEALQLMRDNPNRQDKPLIYHLDVAAMYPNIMLSNRLQPDSVKDEAACAVCDYNRPDKTCDRKMVWSWRGDYFPAKRDEFNMVKHALDQETFPPRFPNGPRRQFGDLPAGEQSALLHKRLGDYSRKVYRKTHETKVVEREAIICQRENPFYIDTVRAFRDRRYEYKGLHKTWKKNLDKAVGDNSGIAEVDEAKKMIVLYDSLQLAHKCILNSFYGYVMRKGARWYSMEMAGITCLTGAKIIQMARKLVEQIGRPLELDTDGIWCMLPGVFPENFDFKLKNGKKFGISYPCTMLNHLVHAQFTNHQYHDLVDKDSGLYEVRSENSIFFELDGPYKAMILPSSKEEDKLLKKRYAVFNHDNSLAELKGFEVKRRGELQLIKIFQSQIFDKFLLGTTTEECYAAVAEVANQWLDILQSRASSLHDEELVELIAENRSMSKTLAEYGGQKSTSISTAKRLAEFLGEQMVKDKGLACKFIISAKPNGAPVTERAVPVAIFTAEEGVKRHFLRKWLKDGALTEFDLRSILDWSYYEERLGSVIQKLITIPAALQKVVNPVPRVRHPDWLFKRVAAKDDKFQQHKVDDMFSKFRAVPNGDVEDIGKDASKTSKFGQRVATVTRKQKLIVVEPEVEEVAPGPRDDYAGWLRVTKQRWRRKRAIAAQNGPVVRAVPKHTGTIKSMIQQKSFSMSSRQWDVVQIAPTSRPGEYRLWLAIDTSFQSVKLRIPRFFYLNFKARPAEGTFDEVYKATSISKTLPRDHVSRHLYLIEVEEQTYLDGAAHFSDLINSPNVDGAYELQMPLHVRALLSFGATCAIKSGVTGGLNRGLDKGFDLTDLEAPGPSLERRQYLNAGLGIRYLYLFHAVADSRQVYGLFSPDSGVKIFYVDPGRNRPQVPNPSRWYQEAMENGDEDRSGGGLYEYPEALRFDVSYHGNDSGAVRALAKEITASRRGGATMLVVHSPLDSAHFMQKSTVFNDLPVLMSSAALEAETSSIMWIVDVTRRMIKQYLKLGEWLANQVAYAGHYDVPLGNTTADFGTFVADIDFARRLQRQDMVLWWSNGSKPDLGGQEQDANGVSLAEERASPQISVKGCYTNAVLEISMADLAINAILQSAIVNEMEGSGAGALAFNSASHNLDEYAKGDAHASAMLGDAVLPFQTFAVLKNMIKTWWMEFARAKIRKGDAKVAGLAVQNFWRWLSSSSSHMFDPALQRFLFALMRKVFLQLLGEFKRLGTQVIYADFNRILLLTSKPDARSAFAFSHYLLTAVSSRELFQDISFDVVHYWDYLAWMDVANFGGIQVAPEMAGGLDGANTGSHTIIMDWNIQAYLPPGVQHYFESQVANFIVAMYEAKLQASDGRTPLRAVHDLNAKVDAATPEAVNPAKKRELDAAHASISQTLTRKLLGVVARLRKRQALSATDEPEHVLLTFPELPGSHLKMHNPTLEFVKMVCEVFGLAKQMQTEVQILKRNLLDLCGVKEFSEEAAFRNPCDSLVLPMVICETCYECRDVDLCRDPDRLPIVPPENKGAVVLNPRRKTWACQVCLTEYDRAQIEAPLVEQITRMRTAYQLQDLTCTKCSQLKVDNLPSTCSCGGSFRSTVNRFDLKRRLQGILNIAQYHGLALVGHYAEQTLAAW